MPTDRMPMGATMERTSGGRSMDQMPAEREPEEDISDRIPMDRMSGGETTMERTSGSRSMDRMPAEREPEEDMSDRIPMDRMSPGNMAVDDMPMEEMAVRTEWGGPAERGRRCRRYVTKEGDTLEKVLGVESIPLRKGMVICCR